MIANTLLVITLNNNIDLYLPKERAELDTKITFLSLKKNEIKVFMNILASKLS